MEIKSEKKERILDSVIGFLEGWKKGNRRTMYKHCQKTWKKKHKKKHLNLFKENPIKNFSVLSITKKGEALFDVYVIVQVDKRRFKTRMRVIAEQKPYQPDPGGKFGVNPTSIQW